MKYPCCEKILLITVYFLSGQNQYDVKRGERPPIDLASIPAEAYEPGRFLIKLKPEFHKVLPDIMIAAPKNGFVKTGIAGLDTLNNRY